METATTPEGFLGSRVDTEMTFAGGARMEVSIRLRKGGGVAEGSMVTLREVGRRGSVGIRLEMLKALTEDSLTALQWWIGDKAAREAAGGIDRQVDTPMADMPFKNGMEFAAQLVRENLHYPTKLVRPRHDECPGAPRCRPWEDYS